MEWYGPLTVLPAIGLLIMSTSNFIVSLNSEIIALEQQKQPNIIIIELKLIQLKRLGIANASLYASALLFLIAGLAKVILSIDQLFDYFMLSGVISTTIGLTFLFIHSLKSVSIRQKHLELRSKEKA